MSEIYTVLTLLFAVVLGVFTYLIWKLSRP